MSSEAKLLRRALRGEIKQLIELGFDPDILRPPFNTALQTLADAFLRSGEILPKSRLLSICEGLLPQHIAEKAGKKATHYWSVIQADKIDYDFQSVMESITEAYNERTGDPRVTLQEITKQLLDLNSLVAHIDVSIPSNAVIARQLRQEYFDAGSGNTPGIPFPPEFPLLIESLVRLRPAHIVTIAARTEVGKTWLALLFTLHAAVTGHKVIIASMEMTPSEIIQRLCALFARVNFDRVLKGTLQRKSQRLYLNVLDGFKNGQKFWKNLSFVDPSEITSVEAVEMKAANFGAELVVADAFYDWPHRQKEDYKGIRENLKIVRRVSLITRRCWILAAQLNRQADKVYTSDEFAMGGSDAFNYLSNYVINIIQRKKDKKTKHMILKLGKKRNAAYSPPRIHNWDFMRMNYTQIGIYNESKSIISGGGDF